MWKVVRWHITRIQAFYIVRRQLFANGGPLYRAHYEKVVCVCVLCGNTSPVGYEHPDC